MTSKSAVAAIPRRHSSLRRTRVAALLLATPLAAMTWQVTHAATVEFRLSPDSKGREQRIASELAASVGATSATRAGNGVFSITANEIGKSVV